MNKSSLVSSKLKLKYDVNKSGVIFLLGPSGSGKTAVAKRLACEIKWESFDTDQEILRVCKVQKISTVFDNFGEKYFRERENEIIKELSKNRRSIIVATGGGLPAIPGMIKFLNQIGSTVYLRANIDILWKRLSMDPKELDDRPLLKLDGKKTLMKLLAKRERYYKEATITLNTDQLTLDEVCDILKSFIRIHLKSDR